MLHVLINKINKNPGSGGSGGRQSSVDRQCGQAVVAMWGREVMGKC